jgi:hypothetical protein
MARDEDADLAQYRRRWIELVEQKIGLGSFGQLRRQWRGRNRSDIP